MQKLELDLIVQKEMGKQIEEKLTKIYEGQISKMENQIENLLVQLKWI